jgi:hypothetical protein
MGSTILAVSVSEPEACARYAPFYGRCLESLRARGFKVRTVMEADGVASVPSPKSLEFRPGQLAFFKARAKCPSLCYTGRASNAENSQPAAARRVALKMGRLLRARRSRIDQDVLLPHAS